MPLATKSAKETACYVAGFLSGCVAGIVSFIPPEHLADYVKTSLPIVGQLIILSGLGGLLLTGHANRKSLNKFLTLLLLGWILMYALMLAWLNA